jgi:hypothetical protein
MKTILIEPSNVTSIARMMNNLKPEWWSIEGALSQLNTGVGWYLSNDNDNEPIGWILCKELRNYKSLQIECMGIDNSGILEVNNKLTPLITECVNHCIMQELRNITFIIGSRGLSCHQRKLKSISEELKELKAIERPEFEWLMSLDFKPSGIYPNIYGQDYHGILLIKEI